MLRAACCKCKTQKIAKNWPSGHLRATSSGYIFSTEAHIDNRKILLSSNISFTCPHNMVNFGPLMAAIDWRVLGHPIIFQRVSRLGSVTARYFISGRQPNFVELNRRRGDRHVGHWPTFLVSHITYLLTSLLSFLGDRL